MTMEFTEDYPSKVGFVWHVMVWFSVVDAFCPVLVGLLMLFGTSLSQSRRRTEHVPTLEIARI